MRAFLLRALAAGLLALGCGHAIAQPADRRVFDESTAGTLQLTDQFLLERVNPLGNRGHTSLSTGPAGILNYLSQLPSAGTAVAGDTVALSRGGSTYTISIPSLLPMLGTIPLSQGGTGGGTASTARTNLGAAASGANGDITSFTALAQLLVNRGSMPAGLTGFVGGAFQATQLLGSASLYVGAANLTTAQCVATPADCSYVGGSSVDMGYFDSTALANLYSLNGGIGVVGASRASDSTGNSPIGVAAFALSDDTVHQRGAWAIYSSSVRKAGAGTLFNEVVVANAGSSVVNNAYNVAPTGVTADLWLGSGGEYAQSGGTTNPISCTICIISENAIQSSLAGIVIAYNALSGDNGTTGTAIAIQMARGHEVDWIYDTTGTVGFGIRSDATAAGMKLIATQADLKLVSSAAATLADFTSGGSLTLAGFVTGSRALVTPAGTNLAGATALTTQVALLNSAAAGSGVTLPNVAVGTQVWITNGTGNAQNIYPSTSAGTINGGPAGAAISLANGASVIFTLVSTGSWFSH